MRLTIKFLLAVGCAPFSLHAWAQDSAALLREVIAAHGVGQTTLSTQVLLQGRYVTQKDGKTVETPISIKIRGYFDVRFEVVGVGDPTVSVQAGGFRWSQQGTKGVRSLHGKYSLNIPFMDSPSTGLLAYLFDNISRVVWLKSSSGTVGRLSVRWLVLEVPDADQKRRTLGIHFDRRYELLVDAASNQLLGATVIPNPSLPYERDSYAFEDYKRYGGLLFPSRIKRQSGDTAGLNVVRTLNTLEIDTAVLGQFFPNSDFTRPAR